MRSWLVTVALVLVGCGDAGPSAAECARNLRGLHPVLVDFENRTGALPATTGPDFLRALSDEGLLEADDHHLRCPGSSQTRGVDYLGPIAPLAAGDADAVLALCDRHADEGLVVLYGDGRIVVLDGSDPAYDVAMNSVTPFSPPEPDPVGPAALPFPARNGSRPACGDCAGTGFERPSWDLPQQTLCAACAGSGVAADAPALPGGCTRCDGTGWSRLSETMVEECRACGGDGRP